MEFGGTFSFTRVCAPIIESFPINFPHIILTFIPVWEFGPIIAPNFLRPESIKFPFIFTLMVWLSKRKLDNFVPAPRLTPSHIIESPI